jgi:hypothetical protein
LAAAGWTMWNPTVNPRNIVPTNARILLDFMYASKRRIHDEIDKHPATRRKGFLILRILSLMYPTIVLVSQMFYEALGLSADETSERLLLIPLVLMPFVPRYSFSLIHVCSLHLGTSASPKLHRQ